MSPWPELYRVRIARGGALSQGDRRLFLDGSEAIAADYGDKKATPNLEAAI
ncbi:hypothetical protein [Synechococcus elongatus]|uniref:hypothetical protein n=1 Tax=Synechococcus elongatus TaxID=32046 RepID=UPI0003116B0F|nr:hypothetical protein [Synechococcus elongatus]MBD2588332.1 hypothetical protein [Synechococcus elongatus FACHB-242]MBD2689505.1 hypothetical protein [Synechococcus elongatus FACHB-1061]MBD2708076.1 hypothetical protein [Synechococcus elongatus PCC 7942 = FACHB-805]UOW71314.1 hypothetical protein PCC7943_1565 [Synechococcus elongatus PCC 7943]UOW74139.1 hypothetical protein PCC6311_1671 [Synechococcus elongatus PCC 6311]